MKVISLNGQWNLKFFPQEEGSRCEAIEIPCTVPGNVELDLSAAGILPKDLFMGDNIRQAEKYETYEWWYSRDFDAPVTNEKIFLHFKGVDCIAEYFLNDELIGSSKNALIPIEFDITEKIRDVNNLKVRIKSALLEAYDIDYETYVLKNGWGLNPESIYIRKPPHCYGWDIMPRAVSAGIWKDAELHLVSDMEIEDISYTVKSLSEQEAAVRFVYELRLPVNSVEKVKLQVEGKCGGSSFSFEVTPKFKAGYVDITIKNPKLWWPYGYGEPNVYNLTAKIIYGDTISTVNTFTLGLRTVELRRTDVTDGINGCFEFIVNGVKVICKGSNWVPMDAYHSRDKERYAKALELFSDIGCNIIRLWGGNVYEQEEFYNYCDRHGIMVWQDFTMACHAYPQDESFLEVIKDEAKVIIKSLRNHPCIILWSGDNENDTLLLACGTNPNKNRLTREILPESVRLYDDTRPYLASSPYVSEGVYASGNTDIIPEIHLWGPRDYFKSTYYTTFNAHFISEIGYHGCPCEESIRKFIEPEFVWPYQNNPQWILHSSDQRRNDHRVMLMENQIRQLFGTVPDNLRDYALASQISQAEAKKFFIENVRCNRQTKSGIIWWNLIDGWPQMSDAVVDYYYVKKLAYEYIKRSQQPFAIMISEIECWNCNIVAANDTLEEKLGTFEVVRYDNGEIVAAGEFNLSPNSGKTLGKIPVMYSENALYIIKWRIGDTEYKNHYISGYPPLDFAMYREYLTEILL